MKPTADKLEQIQQLINSNYRQDAAMLLRAVVQKEPNNPRAWQLLSQVTNGRAREMCLKRVAILQTRAQKEANGEVVSTPPAPMPDLPSFPTVKRAKAVAPIIAPQRPAAVPVAQKQHLSDRTLGRWATIVFAGLLLGCLSIFAIARFGPDSSGREVSAQDNMNAQMIAAVVETATPAESIPTETAEAIAQAEPLPTLQPTFTPTPQELAAKQVGDGEPRAEWTQTPTPTPTFTPTPTIEPTRLTNGSNISNPAVGESERWVDVNLTLQTLTAYEGKSPVMQTIISSGRPPYYTVTGTFRVYYRLPEQTMDGRRLGFDYVTPGVPHVQYFYGDFAIHGATWHNDFGTPVSHGCVNVTPADAEWLYNWMSYGTLVSVHY